MPNSDITQLLATTHRRITPQGLFDQVKLRSEIMDNLEDVVNLKADGASYDVDIIYDDLNDVTVKTDSSGTFSMGKTKDLASGARFHPRKPIITPIRLDYVYLLLNSESSQRHNTLQTYFTKAIDAQRQYLEDIFGAASTGNDDPYSLATLADDTAELGGIDPTVSGNEYWAATVESFDLSQDGNIEDAVELITDKLYDTGVRQYDTVLAGKDAYAAFRRYLRETDGNYRINQNAGGTAKMGFKEVELPNGIVVRRTPRLENAGDVLFLDKERVSIPALEWMVPKDPRDVVLHQGGENVGTLEDVYPTVTVLNATTNERRAHGKLQLSGF